MSEQSTVIVEFSREALDLFVELWNRNEVLNENGDRITLKVTELSPGRAVFTAKVEITA